MYHTALKKNTMDPADILVLLWSVPPPDLVDFGVSVMGSEVVKKHQKAQHSSELNNRFSVVMSSREKAPKSTT